MTDEPSCSRSRDIDRHEADIRDIRRELREEYIFKELFYAHITPLEQNRNNTWLSNRNALLAVASVIVGIIVSAYLARGGH